MAGRTRVAVLRIAATAMLAVALQAASAAANTPSGSISGSLGTGANFPIRTMTLSAPANVDVSVPDMYIWENGGPVYDLSVTPVTHGQADGFGVELVIDQSSSMSGAPLARELAAARALAAQRTANQKLGVIAFDSTPSAVLPLTSDRHAIDQVLTATPWTGAGTKIVPAVSLALDQLKAANVAEGAVIVLSDGAFPGSTAAARADVTTVAAAAQRQHVPIFTVGLPGHTLNPGPLRQLARLGGGQYTTATGPQLQHVFASIGRSLTRSYLIRYRSIVPRGRQVAVKVHVDGVPAKLHVSYFAPAPAAAAASHASAGSGSTGAGAPPPAVPSPAPRKPHLVKLPTFAQPVVGWKPTPQRRSFWTSSAGLLAVAGGCALLIGLAIAILLYRHPSRRALRRRVGDFIVAGHAELAAPAQEEAPKGLLVRLLANRRWWPQFVEQLQTARIRRDPLSLVRRTAVGSAVVAVVFTELTGSIVLGILVLLAAPFALRGWVARGARRQRKLFAEQLPTNLQDLAGAMRAGRSFVGAIQAVAETSAEPMRGELERAMTDERLGLPLEETLEGIARRMEAKDVDQIALIAALHRSSGSNVAEALDRVAEGARERADLAREIRALTGQARLSSWVLSGLPPAMLVGLSVIAPQYSHPLFHTTLGIVLLVVAACMVGAGWAVMRRIINPEA